MAKKKITKEQLLLVEGKDECNFFEALLTHERIEEVQCIDIGGKDKFSNEFPVLVNMEGFKAVSAIGLVRDAEVNQAKSAFESLCYNLKEHNLPVPSPNALNSGPPKVNIFIMPDNQGAGMLEDLCLKTIEGQAAEKCLCDYLSCILTNPAFLEEREKFNKPKAKVQAYLATRTPIVNSLGLGAKAGYWDFSPPGFDEVKKFLHTLFG